MLSDAMFFVLFDDLKYGAVRNTCLHLNTVFANFRLVQSDDCPSLLIRSTHEGCG
jgi:hypothetical protein